MMQVGDKVTLTPQMMQLQDEAGYGAAEMYRSGVVTAVGSWDIVYVKFIGIDHPIGVRRDEIIHI